MRLILDILNPNSEAYQSNNSIDNFEFTLYSVSNTAVKSDNFFIVDWGDGVKEKYNQLPITHRYKTDINSIIYRIIVEYEGSNSALYYLTFKDQALLKRVEGILPPLSTVRELFKNNSNLSLLSSNIFLLNTDHNDITSIFENCTSLEYTKSLSIITGIKIADKSFKRCAFKHVPILKLNKVISMNEAFMDLKNLISIPMKYFFEAQLLESAERIFYNCENLEFIGYNPFLKCTSLKTIEDGFVNTKVKFKDNFSSYFMNQNIRI